MSIWTGFKVLLNGSDNRVAIVTRLDKNACAQSNPHVICETYVGKDRDWPHFAYGGLNDIPDARHTALSARTF